MKTILLWLCNKCVIYFVLLMISVAMSFILMVEQKNVKKIDMP